MRKESHARYLTVCALIAAASLLFAAAGHATATSIRDVDLTDQNAITSTFVDAASNTMVISEDYNERYLVGYPSDDGLGIVNANGGFFDKVVTFEAGDLDGPWTFEFQVLNTSPYCWSDYHFEFWNEDFTQRLVNFPLQSWSNQIFQNSAYPGPFNGPGVLEFWKPDWQCPGSTNTFMLAFDPSLINNGQPVSFGIRQVATTIPEPLTMLGLFLGVSGVGTYVRKRMRTRI